MSNIICEIEDYEINWLQHTHGVKTRIKHIRQWKANHWSKCTVESQIKTGVTKYT